MTNPLFLIRLAFTDPLELLRFSRDEGLPTHAFDADYAAHCVLGRLFGPDAPKPFSLPGGSFGELLAYSVANHERLEDQARIYARPEAWRLVDWPRFSSKPMPEDWRPGARLSFTLRVCPVVRGPSGHGKNGPGKSAAPEVDAYLAHVWRTGDSPSREEVYLSWLEKEMGREGGARLLEARALSFRLGRFFRRDRARGGHYLTRPEVRFGGALEITNGDGFARLLARGVGRHRAFGFGMILLSPRRAS